MRFTYLLALAGSAFAASGCFLFDSSDDPPPGACPAGQRCDSGRPDGPIHGLRADGTVDVDADAAWPNRADEAAPLSADEVAQACALLAACTPVQSQDEMNERRLLYSLCVDPDNSYFWEERAVPTNEKDSRWTFEARAIIAAKGDCDAVNNVSQARAPEIICEEVGCWWSSPNEPVPDVACNGDVATLATLGKTIERDCSRALAKCDASSPTGCTDRAPVGCEHPATDRCDGAIRIGCDGSGRVSFHDCGRVPGGKCGDLGDGSLGCIYPSGCMSGPAVCSGTSLSACVLGTPDVVIDCAAIGLSPCAGDFCAAK